MQVELQPKVTQETYFLLHKRLLVIVFLFLTALGVRLYHANEPPLNFHAVRQYHSLIIARGYYFETLESIPAWQNQIAQINKQKQGMWEPHIVEFFASVVYRIAGGERLWIPKLLSSLFWLTGGGFLYLIARKIADEDAAVFSTALYLLLPFAVSASRSFQPDPLMVMGLLIGVFAILQYYDRPSRRRLLVAAIVSALAILVKAVSLFSILGAFIAAGIYTQGFRKTATGTSSLIFIFVSLLPALAFYFYQIFISKSLLGVAQGNILPHLLLYPFFWRGWLYQIGEVVGYPLFIGALLGSFFFHKGLPRGLLMGLWIGYFIFGLVFTYTIHTHDYWNLQLVPIAALSIGPIGTLVINRLEQVCTQWHSRLAVWGILLLAVLLSIGMARLRIIDGDFEGKVRTAEEIGKQVNHSPNTVILSGDYGLPLEYHGQLSGRPWPLVSDLEWERLVGRPLLEAEARFQTRFAQDSPDYFIIADMWEFEQQADLRLFLTKNFPMVAEGNDYLIFDLQPE